VVESKESINITPVTGTNYNLINPTTVTTQITNDDGDASDNILEGADGDDTLIGGGGNDTLIGGKGNDTYIIDVPSDVITENSGEGTDTVNSPVTYTLGANVENLTLTATGNLNGTGNALNNTIIGNSGNNLLTGNDGNDSLAGGVGVDTLLGGKGDDVYTIDNVADVVTENANEGTDTLITPFSTTLNAALENLTLLDTGNLTGTGNVSNNILKGNTGNNLLTGDDGNDSLAGGAGVDTLLGGKGDDVYTIDNVADVVTENANEGTDTLITPFSTTLNAIFENLTLLGSGNLTGTGNTVNNFIIGNDGNNNLTGLDGADTLNGGIGADTLIGGKGDDTYVIDNAGDVITENANEGTDTVQSSLTYSLTNPNLENLTLIGNNNIDATGNASNNVLTGNSKNNTLIGLEGNDTLIGGTGDDNYVIDLGDVITEIANQGIDTVRVSLTYTLTNPNLENITLLGDTTTNATGNGASNLLVGNSSNNTLSGDLGNDTLIGNAGNDTLVGGGGQDFFVFNGANEGNDNINDFSPTDDKISVSASGFGSGLVPGVLNANRFILGTAATTPEQRFIYNATTGAFSFDANGNVAGSITQIATLSTGLALTSSNILVI
jgi:Ca2+-binding RTX toxin-like protein